MKHQQKHRPAGRGCTCPERVGRRLQDSAGFTILEVIVALAVLAVIMVPLTIVLTQTLGQTRDVSDRLQRSSDAQRIGAAWVRDVQSLDRVGTDGSGPCAGLAAGGTDLVTFYWDQAPNVVDSGQPELKPRSATWAATGTGAGMRLVRRECESGVMTKETFLADRIGDEGQSPLQALHGPGGPGTRNYCTAVSCTLVVSGSFDYEVTGTRRVSGDIAADQAPPPPTITGVSERNKYLSVAWTPPALPAGTSAITGYRVEAWRTPTGGLVSSTEINASSNSADVTGLSNGVSYWVVVYSRNAVGFGEPSDAWGPVSPKPTAPSPVRSVTVVAGGVDEPGTLDVTWVVPEDTGSVAIDNYELSVKRQSDGTTTTFMVSGSTFAYPVPNLVPGTTYDISVRAHNDVGWGSFSDPVPGVTRPPTPTGLSATPGNGKALVTFTLSGNGDKALLATNAVRITARCTVASPSCTNQDFVLNHPSPSSPNSTAGPLDTSTAVPVTSLVNGQTYNIRVEVQNSSGWGPVSAPVAVTPVTNPQSPAALVSIEATTTANGLKFSIAPGADSGGSTITSYEVTDQSTGRKRSITAASTGNTDFTWGPADATVPAGGVPLANFVNRTFKVEACNIAGCSGSSPGYVAAPGIPPQGTIAVTMGAAANSIVVTGNPVAGATSSATTWSVTCGSKTQSITGPNGSTTFTGMDAGVTNCSGTPTNNVQRVLLGASGNLAITGTASAGSVEVYGPPARPNVPAVTLVATGPVNQVTVAPTGAPGASGGSDPALRYVAQCGGVPSSLGAGARNVAGLSPMSTVSCTITAYNVAGYASAASNAVSVLLRRAPSSIQSFNGTRSIVVQSGSQGANSNKFRGMAVIRHDPGLAVSSLSYGLGRTGAAGTVAVTPWRTVRSGDDTYDLSYVWISLTPPNGDWVGIPSGGGVGRAAGLTASMTFSITGDTAGTTYGYYAVSELDGASGEDLPAIHNTSDSTDGATLGSTGQIRMRYACDDNDSAKPHTCDSMRIRIRRVDGANTTVELSCNSKASGPTCETRTGTSPSVIGFFNADDNENRDYTYNLPNVAAGYWVIEGLPCNETGPCPDFWGSSLPAGLDGASFWQMMGSFRVS